MLRLSNIGSVMAVAVVLWAGHARAQCTKDVDCKGNRVCQQGSCVEIAAPPASAPARPQLSRADHYFRRGYGSIAALMVPRTWVGSYNDGTYAQGFEAGVHVSGLAVLSQRAHLGGYLSWHDLGPQHLVGLGIAVKAGGMVGDRVWLGFALDFGMLFLTGGPETLYGLDLFPRFQLEVGAVDVGGFRLAPVAALGSMGMPVGNVAKDVLSWFTAVGILVGASFGS